MIVIEVKDTMNKSTSVMIVNNLLEYVRSMMMSYKQEQLEILAEYLEVTVIAGIGFKGEEPKEAGILVEKKRKSIQMLNLIEEYQEMQEAARKIKESKK